MSHMEAPSEELTLYIKNIKEAGCFAHILRGQEIKSMFEAHYFNEWL